MTTPCHDVVINVQVKSTYRICGSWILSIKIVLLIKSNLMLLNKFVMLKIQDRGQLISNMPVQVKKCLTTLNGSLTGKVKAILRYMCTLLWIHWIHLGYWKLL